MLLKYVLCNVLLIIVYRLWIVTPLNRQGMLREPDPQSGLKCSNLSYPPYAGFPSENPTHDQNAIDHPKCNILQMIQYNGEIEQPEVASN